MHDTDWTVEIVFPSVEREVEGHDEFMREVHQSAWRDLPRLASERVYTHGRAKVAIELDWSLVARRLLEVSSKARKRPPKHLSISATVSIAGEVPSGRAAWHYPQFFVSYHLCNVFLAMNISAPGSADFGGVRVSMGAELPEAELDLSGYDYDYAWTSSLDGQWPAVQRVALDSCFDWLAPLERRAVQIADSDIERLLLSLLRIAQMDSSPDSAVWICAGLEALFPTSFGKTQPQLNSAISELLGANDKQKEKLKAYLRAIYSLRNAFAHGNLPITHPYSNERIEERVEREFDRYVDAHLDGVRLLLACVQRLVMRDSRPE